MTGPGKGPRERFSQRATSYDLGRPRYPDALFAWYQERFGLSAETVVADVGAGTGLHTAGLLAITGLVWAIEPNEAMRARAESRFARTPKVRVVAGSAESTGVPAGSVDLVTAAQAFHWFDPEGFALEVHRIQARPAAWALVWNVRDPDANRFTAGYEALLHRWGDGYGGIRSSWGDPERVARFSGALTETQWFENVLPLDLEAARANMASCSFMPPAGSPAAADAQNALEALFARESEDGRVDLVYRTLVIAPAGEGKS